MGLYIRKCSDIHNDELIRLIEKYHKYNTQDITLKEAKEYYEELNKNK